MYNINILENISQDSKVITDLGNGLENFLQQEKKSNLKPPKAKTSVKTKKSKRRTQKQSRLKNR